MNLQLATFIVACLCLLAILVDLFVSARFARPYRRRLAEQELANQAVSAAEFMFRGKPKSGFDKGRTARQFLIDHGVSPSKANVLVEKTVSDLHLRSKTPAPPSLVK